MAKLPKNGLQEPTCLPGRSVHALWIMSMNLAGLSMELPHEKCSEERTIVYSRLNECEIALSAQGLT